MLDRGDICAPLRSGCSSVPCSRLFWMSSAAGLPVLWLARVWLRSRNSVISHCAAAAADVGGNISLKQSLAKPGYRRRDPLRKIVLSYELVNIDATLPAKAKRILETSEVQLLLPPPTANNWHWADLVLQAAREALDWRKSETIRRQAVRKEEDTASTVSAGLTLERESALAQIESARALGST